MGVVHSGRREAPPTTELISLGPSLYHWSDDGEYAKWLKEYPDSVCDVMATSHHECLRDGSDNSKEEGYALLEPCEILTKEEWLQGGLMP